LFCPSPRTGDKGFSLWHPLTSLAEAFSTIRVSWSSLRPAWSLWSLCTAFRADQSVCIIQFCITRTKYLNEIHKATYEVKRDFFMVLKVQIQDKAAPLVWACDEGSTHAFSIWTFGGQHSYSSHGTRVLMVPLRHENLAVWKPYLCFYLSISSWNPIIQWFWNFSAQQSLLEGSTSQIV
jgi:hypothetical protein